MRSLANFDDILIVVIYVALTSSFQVDHVTTPFPDWAAFNWTASYRVDSTLHTPYGMWMPWTDIQSAGHLTDTLISPAEATLTQKNDSRSTSLSFKETLVDEEQTKRINDDVTWR